MEEGRMEGQERGGGGSIVVGVFEPRGQKGRGGGGGVDNRYDDDERVAGDHNIGLDLEGVDWGWRERDGDGPTYEKKRADLRGGGGGFWGVGGSGGGVGGGVLHSLPSQSASQTCASVSWLHLLLFLVFRTSIVMVMKPPFVQVTRDECASG
ncbi:hypothetical protein Pmani_005415 [Petrolisthes manimaculis]|uniref:Uncharacterized protein n=1 Tax=Petrolisthes manimaculis TaxID=1843537 RepID=A0AAE1QC73_9EUCA|nr:hypothetical protein Pmani_005415 [Petrolisthes manimaculis]